MPAIAPTPKPPYDAVIFTSLRTEFDEGYAAMASKRVALAAHQPGLLGYEAARDTLGISVSYWHDLAAITAWRHHAEHQLAQQCGRERFYSTFKARIALVERDCGMP